MKKILHLFILLFVLSPVATRAQIALLYKDTAAVPGQQLVLGVHSAFTKVTVDDRFSEAINIGFPFTYFDSTYQNLVISDNNFISFDTSRAGTYCPFRYADLVNQGYFRHSILSPFQDLYLGGGGSIRYMMLGTAPNRSFIIEYCRIPLYGGGCDTIVTDQLILNEGSNQIDMYIASKPSYCTFTAEVTSVQGLWKDTAHIYVPGHDVIGVYWPAYDDGRRFTPAGNGYTISTVPYKPWHMMDSNSNEQLKWYNEQGTLLGQGSSITVTPGANTHYYTVRYNGAAGCDSSLFSFIDTVYIRRSGDTTSPTGINLVKEGFKKIQVYPNPAHQLINIESRDGTVFRSLSLLDMCGKEVLHKETGAGKTRYTLSLQGMAAGIYYMKIITVQGMLYRKIQITGP